LTDGGLKDLGDIRAWTPGKLTEIARSVLKSFLTSLSYRTESGRPKLPGEEQMRIPGLLEVWTMRGDGVLPFADAPSHFRVRGRGRDASFRLG
jgi:hypothetical protein